METELYEIRQRTQYERKANTLLQSQGLHGDKEQGASW